MDKFLSIINRFKYLLIALFFIGATIALVLISASRGDELLKEMNDNNNLNANVDIYKDENKEEIVKICLYYIDKDNKKLVEEYREIKLNEYIVNPEDVIIKEYIKGSNNPILCASIPKATIVNDVSNNGDTVIINFKEICGEGKLDGVDNTLMLESIVKTMKQLKDVSKVKFKVEGKEVNEFCNIKEFNREY